MDREVNVIAISDYLSDIQAPPENGHRLLFKRIVYILSELPAVDPLACTK
jgi:hypothetical protein